MSTCKRKAVWETASAPPKKKVARKNTQIEIITIDEEEDAVNPQFSENDSAIQIIDLSQCDINLIPTLATNEAHKIGSAIWAKIFFYLNDTDRWALARTNYHYMNLFKDLVGFDNSPIIYRADMEILPVGWSPFPHEDDFTTKDCCYTLLNTKLMNYNHHMALFGKHLGRSGLTRKIADNYCVVILRDARNDFAIVPVENDSINKFPSEIIDWFPFRCYGRRFSSYLPSGDVEKEKNISITWNVRPSVAKVDFIFRINHKAVDHAIKKCIATKYEKQVILLSIKYHAIETFENLDWMSSSKGNFAQQATINQPKGFKDIKLHNYQLKALTWMNAIETNAFKKDYKFSTLYETPGKMKWFVNVATSRTGSKSKWNVYPEDNPDIHHSFRLRGGIMADEMGLGKTISMLALILANPRIQSKKLNGDSEFTVNHTGRVLFETKATLVVCAPHLVSQWANEINSKTSLVVKRISTLANIKSATYQDILDADVVIAPYSLLTKNKKYGANYNMGEENKKKINPESKNTILHYFGWHRIIADEAHDIDWDSIRIWNMYHSNYRWYVTGTPFPKGRESLVKAILFLGIQFSKEILRYVDIPKSQQYNSRVAYDALLWEAVKKNAFIRHTKFDVAIQTDIPPLSESVTYLELSPIEQAIYDAAEFQGKDTETLLRKICSAPRSALPNYLRFTKLHETPLRQVNYFKDQIIGGNENLKAAKLSAKHYKENMQAHLAELEFLKTSTCGSAFEIESTEMLIKQLKPNIHQTEKRILNFTENLSNACHAFCIYSRLLLASDTATCGICTKPITNNCKTICEHKFCAACILPHVQENNNCPLCFVSLGIGDLAFGSVQSTNIVEEKRISLSGRFDNDALLDVIDLYGSKMAAVAEYLLDVVLSPEILKVIVFSQYHDLLDSLIEVLNNVNPEAFQNQIVLCKGNIHVRTKKLKEFNSKLDKSPRILMLSLLNSASGTQLEVASHIVLLDPVVGTRDEVQAIDAQAIARAHRLGQDKPVEVVRFICSSTIEQTDYENAYGKPSRAKSARK